MEREYTMATRDYLYSGCDGYEELPNCINIDDTTDITTLFDICLKYFEIVKNLNGDLDNLSDEEYLEPDIFGFEISNKSLKNYLRETVIFENRVPLILIISNPRINIIDI
jgi:hypothetical protein